MEASYVGTNSLTTKHISAAIIDLAIRGYIKIVEHKERFKTKHELVYVKAPDSTLTDDETALMQKLFEGVEVGSGFKLEDKNHKMYKIAEDLIAMLDEKALKHGYYEASPKKTTTALAKHITVSILLLIIGFLVSSATSGVYVVTGFASLIAVFIYNAYMAKRSQSGNQLVEHFEGLKLYIDTAEKDRIAAQDAVAAPLAARGAGPVRDVKFFEKLLPYAIALGAEKTWAKSFRRYI